MFDVPLTPEKLGTILASLRSGLENLLGDQLEAVVETAIYGKSGW